MALAVTASGTHFVISAQSRVKEKNVVTALSTMTNTLYQEVETNLLVVVPERQHCVNINNQNEGR